MSVLRTTNEFCVRFMTKAPISHEKQDLGASILFYCLNYRRAETNPQPNFGEFSVRKILESKADCFQPRLNEILSQTTAQPRRIFRQGNSRERGGYRTITASVYPQPNHCPTSENFPSGKFSGARRLSYNFGFRISSLSPQSQPCGRRSREQLQDRTWDGGRRCTDRSVPVQRR